MRVPKTRIKRKFKSYTAKAGGWSDWAWPVKSGYLLQCCKCGLVHEVKFQTYIEYDRKGERFLAQLLPRSIFRTVFKMRRRVR